MNASNTPLRQLTNSTSRLLAAAALLAALPAYAVDVTWEDTPADTDFQNGANWEGGTAPDATINTAALRQAAGSGAGDTAIFTGTPTALQPTLTADQYLRGMVFQSAGWDFGSSAFALYLSRYPNGAITTTNTSGTNTINNSISFGHKDTAAVGLNIAAGGTLRINGGVGHFTQSSGGGAIIITGGGIVEINGSGSIGGWDVQGDSTLKIISGTGGLNGNNQRLTITDGLVELGGNAISVGGLGLAADGELTNTGSTVTFSIVASTNPSTLAGIISGSLNMAFGNNGSPRTYTITNAGSSYTGTSSINGNSHLVVTSDVLLNTDSPLGNSSANINLGSSGNSGSASLLTNGAIEIARNIVLGAKTNAATTQTLGAAASQVGDSEFSGTITVGTATQAHLTVTAPTGVAVSFTGNILESGTAGNGNLNKIGAGTVVLGGDNNYAGTTAVTDGTLLVNGTHTGGGAYTVDAIGTLGGTGSTASAVTVNGTVAPGSSIGTLTVGAATFADDSDLVIELGSAGASDRLAVVGTLDLSSLLDTLTLTGAADGSSYTLATYGALAGTFNTVAGLPANYVLSYGSGTNDAITLTLVPEPGTLALAAAGGLLIFARRRGA